MKFILIIIVIFFNIGAHILFKFASIEITNITFISLLTNWKIIVGGILQVVALITWIKLLQNVELYWAALMTAMIPLGLVLVSVLFFGEIITLNKLFGAFFIMLGLYIIN